MRAGPGASAGGSGIGAQPILAVVTAVVSASCLALTWVMNPPNGETVGQFVLAVALVGAFIVTRQFPIHVYKGAKIWMGSVPCYLMATLLLPAAAGTAAVVALLAAEIMDRRSRGLYASDIITNAGRWTVLVVFASIVAHVPSGLPFVHIPLIAAGVALWGGDVLTCPLVVTPITGEKPWTVVATVFARSAWIEAAQYLIGLLGALAAVADIWAVSLLALPTALVYIAGRRSMEIEESTQQVLASMADAVDLRDPLTGGHSRRVTKLVRDVLQEMAIHGSEAEMIVAAARVHDIGKIAIPDHILLKDGPLTEDEWEVVKSHSERGADLLQRYPDFASGVAIIRHHHESWDGTGYPHRLAGEQIPFGARVIAVVDSFDAMTTDRPYRRGMSVEQAVTVLRKNRGVQWDPRVVDAFLRTMSRQYPEDVPALRIVPFPGQGPAATA
jgi:hypothetical protein